MGRAGPSLLAAAAATAVALGFGGTAAAGPRQAHPISIVSVKPSTAAHPLVRGRVNVVPATRLLSFRVVFRNGSHAARRVRVTLRIVAPGGYGVARTRTVRLRSRATGSAAFRHIAPVPYAQRLAIVARIVDARGRAHAIRYAAIFTLP